jgi:hypothetical protein
LLSIPPTRAKGSSRSLSGLTITVNRKIPPKTTQTGRRMGGRIVDIYAKECELTVGSSWIRCR